MDRERATTALVILLAVVVVGTAAAGLADQERASDERSAGLGAGSNTGVGSGNGTGFGVNSSLAGPELAIPGFVVQIVFGGVIASSVVFSVLYVGALLLTGELTALREQLTDALVTMLGLLLLFAGLVLLLWVLGQLFGNGGGGALGGAASSASGPGGSAAGSDLDSPGLPSVVVVAGAVLFVGLVLLMSRRGSGESSTPEPPDVDVDASMTPDRGWEYLFLGDAGDEDPENEVYRVWDELARDVGAAGVHTPAEVGRDAVAAGYDADAVGELTALFREVRYGDAPVDGGRERRARELTARLWDDDRRSDVNP